jgi:hypothetical protein
MALTGGRAGRKALLCVVNALFSIFKHRGGLGPKSLCGNMFYKDHRDIAKKASIPLKMYLNSLVILEKASISLKKCSDIIEIFIKTPHF